MGFRIIALIAGLMMLAACETAPDDGSSTAAGGAGPSGSIGTGSGVTGSGVDRQGMTNEAVGRPRPGTQEELVATIGDRVFFGLDQYNLSPEARQRVDQWATWLRQYRALTVTVEGHADERGTREYNLALGERRAAAVKDYLVAVGVDPNRIGTISYGKERPAVLGSTEEAWAQNRRGVMVVN